MNQPFETEEHELTGKAAMDLFRKDDFNTLALKLVEGYNPDRFDAAAIRVFVQKGAPVVTLYAVDKFKQDQDDYPKNKLPVKKFKLKLSLEDFIRHFKRQVGVTPGGYALIHKNGQIRPAVCFVASLAWQPPSTHRRCLFSGGRLRPPAAP